MGLGCDTSEHVESPLRDEKTSKVDITVVDDEDKVILTTRLPSSLGIRQVKLDIHRRRFVCSRWVLDDE